MGVSYSVEFKIKISEGCEDKVFKDLEDIIGIGHEKVIEHFHLDKVKQNGNNLETYLDLLKVFFSSYSEPAKDITVESNGGLSYNNDFDADYVWLDVMNFVIQNIACYLDDYSYFHINAPDSSLYVIYDGNAFKYTLHSDNIDKLYKKLSDDNKSEVKSDDGLAIRKEK